MLLPHCVCADVPRVETAVDIVVVRHERERWKPTGTARIAGLALPRLTFVAYGDDPPLADRALAPLLDGAGTFLVYPADPPSEWPTALPRRLVFLDGSWAQTRRMFRKLASLAPLPRLWLPDKDTPVLRLRRSTLPHGRSTLEAIADALRLVGEVPAAERLDTLHATYVGRVLRARGQQIVSDRSAG